MSLLFPCSPPHFLLETHNRKCYKIPHLAVVCGIGYSLYSCTDYNCKTWIFGLTLVTRQIASVDLRSKNLTKKRTYRTFKPSPLYQNQNRNLWLELYVKLQHCHFVSFVLFKNDMIQDMIPVQLSQRNDNFFSVRNSKGSVFFLLTTKSIQ